MNLLDDVEDLIYINRGQTHGRLIHDDHLRITHQRTPHREHLLLTTGKRSCDLILTLLQSREMLIDRLERLCDAILILPGIGTEHQVLIDRKLCKYTPALRYMGESRTDHLMARCMRDFLPVIEYMTGTRRNQPRDGLQRRRLAGTIGTDQGDDLALIYMEGNAL